MKSSHLKLNINFKIVLTVLFLFSTSAYAVVDPCTPLLKLQAKKLITTKRLATEIIQEMKKIDKELEKTIANLDKIKKSIGMEIGAEDRSATVISEPSTDTTRIMRAEEINSRVRLNFLKASISLLESEYNKDMEEAIKKGKQ